MQRGSQLWRSVIGLPTLVALSGLAVLTRLARLDAASLWLDELGAWAVVTGASFTELLGLMLDPRAGYPLYHLLLYGWIGLAGDSALALRLPSAIAGVATIAVITVGARVAGRSVPLALGLSAVAPFLLQYAQEATAYSLLLLWGSLWWLALLSYLHGRPRAGLALLLLVLPGLSLHRAAVLVLIGGGLAVLLCAPRLRPPTRTELALRWGGLALLGAGATWALLSGAITGAPLGASQTSPLQVPARALWAFGLGSPAHQSWPLIMPALGLSILGLLRLARAARADRRARGLLIAFTLPLLLMAGQTLLTGRYEPRYLAPLYPLWLLILLPPAAPAARPLVQVAFGAALLAQLAALLQPGGLWGPTPVREQYREAMTELLQTLQPDDRLLIFPASLELVWRYYAPRIDPQSPHLPVLAADDLPPAWPGQREFLLVAPFHAAVTQRALPGGPTLEDPPGTLPCGTRAFHGVSIRCRVVAASDEPTARTTIAIFGEQLVLRDLALVSAPGAQAPGGVIALRMAWERLLAPASAEQLVLRLTRVGAQAPVLVRYDLALGGLRPEQWPLARQRMTDRVTLPLLDGAGRPLASGHYRLTLRVEAGGRPLPVVGPGAVSSDELPIATFAVGVDAAPVCLAGGPDGCGHVRVAGAQLYDQAGPWAARGVQFFLPAHGINDRSFWDERYRAALADGSLDLWLDRAALRLHPNLLRIFVELPRREGDQMIVPTTHATIYDFAERAAARGMRLGLVLHNSADWALTPERQQWIEDLLSYFLARGALDRIAYLNADNEINNHCLPAHVRDCFALDRHYRNGAVAWAHDFYAVVKGRAPQMLVTVGMATELDAAPAAGGVANYFLPADDARSLITAVDLLAPHNYGGNAKATLDRIRAHGFAGPVILEEYGFPTDPAPRDARWSEGPPTCRHDPFGAECIETAPYFVELNLRALRAGDYAGGVAWMLADTTEKDHPNACNQPAFTFDLWTGLLAAGSIYCEGGTLTRQEGAPKATAIRVCAYHTGSLKLCLADAIQRAVP